MSLSSRLTALKKIPEDILVEILVRLPGRSLMRFKCVSRSWFSLISSKYFTTLFFKFSSLGERRVFMCVEDMKDCMLFSSSRNNLEATTDSFPELNRLTLPGMAYLSDFVNALRGLMCFRVGRAPRVPKEIWIRNLATRQVLRLPLVKSNIFKSDDQYCMWNYFGYDHVNNEYKVLNTINHPLWTHKSETRILVLGAGASWRNTKSLTSPPPHHRPRGQGIFINGVLYYGAWSHERRFVLMSFDFNSEEFTLIEFPIEANIKWDGYPHLVNLMNYQYQVALFDGSRLKTECILDLWVLENARKSKWSPKFFDLPCDQLRKSVDMDYLLIRGTSRSGEIMLYDRCFSRNKKITLVIYDLDRNCITRGFVIKTIPSCLGFFALWDDVESIMYLEA